MEADSRPGPSKSCAGDGSGPSSSTESPSGDSVSNTVPSDNTVANSGSPSNLQLGNFTPRSYALVPRANEPLSSYDAGTLAPVNSLFSVASDGRSPGNLLLDVDEHSDVLNSLALEVSNRHQAPSNLAQNQRTENPPYGNAVAAASAVNLQSQSLLSVQSGSDVAYNWQATKWRVKDRMRALFNKELLADVHFVVGKDIPPLRIPAHKFVLSIGSAVFDAMFNGQMASSACDEIELPDIEPAAFLAMLRFLYTDDVLIDAEIVMTTLYTAKKYVIPALEKHCVDFLKQHLSSDNAFMLLTQARLFDENVLAQMCLDTIDKNTVDALSAEGFLDIDHETLCMVLERDTLRVREVVLFNAVVRWAQAECVRCSLKCTPDNQRSVLKRSLGLIRFPLMIVEEFATEVAQCGILSDREVVNLFLYFTVNPKPTSIPFSDGPRCSITGKEQLVHRFARTESRWGYSGTSDRIRFIVDRRIFIVGFGLYGSIHGPSDYDCNIQLIQTGTGKVLATNDTTFCCDGSAHTFRVLFKMPVEIDPNTNYTACATLKGSDSHYGTGGNRKVLVDLHGGGHVTFTFSYAAGCNNGTSVEDGQIPEIIFIT